MKKQTEFSPLLKGLLFWIIFMVMYALQKLYPNIPITLFAAVDESSFQHFKAGFFAYLFLSIIELAIFSKRIPNKKSYCFARLGSSLFFPWVIFIIWYIVPALYGRLPNNTLEIIYGNVVTFFVGIISTILEHGFQQITYSKSLIITLLGLFSVSIMLYIIFTFKLPWSDVFKEANWKELTYSAWRMIYV